ncbi:sugar dehydrogenase [Kribbella sandramycini]|uniref:Glucose/arabinose dehydrogenase/PKD repeat protein n=1 Tax=Kribbella sandramycini TaxID=60450 RepID=A0A7Y4L415_9ACTN|nr:PQQ-dependent sugar dehydrogenase [Kribbella sandramycini]MBB6566547.1 glucose/arabinose dehydrogenase/PKD repeat protein [Kribbella sandramycini]NOL42796.1 sugar dehydrogenase [Kribbella sandramycini]
MRFSADALRRVLVVMCVLLLVPLTASEPARAAATPSGFSEQTVFDGLTNPTNVVFSPDGRVFVAEKSGLIKVFDSLDDTSASVFADLRTKVHNFWDRGLLGLALHPGFPADPRVYVLYTHDALIGAQAPKWGTANASDDPCPSPPGPTSDGCQVSARLSVLTSTGSAVAEQVLIEDWCQVYPSHSIGSIEFGPDGMLYAGGGDGASFTFTDYGQDGYPDSDATPDNACADGTAPVGAQLTPPTAEGGALRSQDLRTSGDPVTLDGSIIRINPDTGQAAPGNPLLSNADLNARRIVAEGLRNPMRFAFRPGTNELWIGDVGYSAWEEINRLVLPAAGVANFGWPCYEGAGRSNAYDSVNVNICESLYAAGAPAVSAPYFAYQHRAHVTANETCTVGSSSLSGMAFYAGGNYPAEYDGALFFSDYSRKCVWAMLPGADGLPDRTKIVQFASGYGSTRLQIGPGGDLFTVDYESGTIRRYVYSATNNPPTAVIQADPASGNAPLQVSFDGTASSDADGHPLSYAWDLDGDGQYDDSTAATVQRTYPAIGPVTVRLRVSDGQGGTATTSTRINVGNTAPTATITGPGPALAWKVGDAISFSGSASDAEQGALPGSALKWTLIMHHCPSDCHQHTITSFTGSNGSFAAPDHEYPSYLELRLTATDAGGLTDVKSVRLDPKTTNLSFASQPSGLSLTYLDRTVKTPAVGTTINGSTGTLAAEAAQPVGTNLYRFASWSDGGARVHNFVAPDAPTTYTATYVPKRNLALKKPVATSSVYLNRPGANAVDGSASTYWSSARSDPQWLRVDLGRVELVDRALLSWLSTSYAKAYQIQISGSGRTWKTVYSTTTGDGFIDSVAFTPNYARYVRINITARGVAGSYNGLWEFGVYGDTGSLTGIAGKCVEVAGSVVQFNTCNGAAAQQWIAQDDGTIRSQGKCLDARSTTPRSPTTPWTCDGSPGQKWTARADGTLLNKQSGLCLDAENGKSANGTRVNIYTCHTGVGQKFLLP